MTAHCVALCEVNSRQKVHFWAASLASCSPMSQDIL